MPRLRWSGSASRWRIVSTRQVWVLRGVHDGLVTREWLFGDLAPWTLHGESVAVTMTVLTLRRMVDLHPFGSGVPTVTARGLRVVNGCD